MDNIKFSEMITFIYVKDLNRSRDFYEGIMKFGLRLDQGSCRIVETNRKGGGLLGYCARGHSSPQADRGIILTFTSGSVDKWYEYLMNRGVIIKEEPQFNPEYNIYHFFFEDPDGYILEIQEFRDPAWQK